MVNDLIKNIIKNLSNYSIKNQKEVKMSNIGLVNFSKKFYNTEKEIKFFLRDKMYNNKNVLEKNNRGKKIIKFLFHKINKSPAKFIEKQKIEKDKSRAISDYISGMTDRFAINLYKSIK